MRDPEIKQQTIIRKQLLGALQSDVLEEVRSALSSEKIDIDVRGNLAMSAFKVTEKTMPDLYALFLQVKKKLEYKENVDLYISSSPNPNAFTYISENPKLPHIIEVTSSLFNILNEDEMKSVIGHEFGHLINQDSRVKRLYSFFYHGDSLAPEIIEERMNQYTLLCEYAADRYGYLACENLKACVSSSFKFNSGLNLDKFNVDLDAMMEENDNHVNYLLSNVFFDPDADHPAESLRIIALWFYVNCRSQKDLEEKMSILYSLIPGLVKSEADNMMAQFCAAAGLKLSMQDGKIDKFEKDMIIEEIAKYALEASPVLKKVQKMDIDSIIDESAKYIAKNDPEKAVDMLLFYIRLAFADKVITKEELELVKSFGKKKLKLEEKTIYNAIYTVIQADYFSLANTL